jgi:hypothetical protein
MAPCGWRCVFAGVLSVLMYCIVVVGGVFISVGESSKRCRGAGSDCSRWQGGNYPVGRTVLKTVEIVAARAVARLWVSVRYGAFWVCKNTGLCCAAYCRM